MSLLFNFIKFYIRLLHIKRKWKRLNKHNNISIANTWENGLFPLSKVSVGRHTCGTLKVICYNNAGGSLQIGSFCSIAQNVVFLLGEEHHTNYLSTFPFKAFFLKETDTIDKGDIIIEDDVWIGYGSIVLSGVKLSQGTIVAAGSVVVSSTEPYSIVGGIPAKMIKKRFDDKLIADLTTIDYKKINEEFIMNNMDLLNTHLDRAVLNKILNIIA